MYKLKNKKILLFSLIFVFVIGLICLLTPSFSEVLDNDVRVAENSDLTYYIDVMYDGIDESSVSSNGSSTVRVFSDYIYVEDKLPDGLEFREFVSSGNGTIGAVRQDNQNVSCVGYVVNGMDGLDYNATTRMVSFKIKNLQAGCKITVGVVTRTPSLGDKSRMDFYNTAFARENEFSTKSNTVHVFMGREEEPVYKVKYQYAGVVPEGAPAAPDEQTYPALTSVAVSPDIVVAGYIFSGWKVKSGGVTVNNGSFTMPSNDVVFEGSFTAKPTYTVTYELAADSDKPDGYMLPKTKSYGAGDDVIIDELKAQDKVNGYLFSGWEIVDDSDITIDDNGDGSRIFVMPPRNVKLRGKFTRIDYQVSYQFQGNILPPNYQNLLPSPTRHYPGDIVKVAPNPTADGFEFLGWYTTDSFEMPEEDVVIVGEWMRKLGTFKPKITKTIDNPKASYQDKDEILFTIVVENTASFNINDVFIREDTEGSVFIDNGTKDYTLLSDNYVKIPKIGANSSVSVKAKYIATSDPVKNVVNKVSLVGALAENNYTLEEGDYVATAEFSISNITLNVNKMNKKKQLLTGAQFALYKDANTAQLVGTGLSFRGLSASTIYYLKETKAPKGYMLLNKVLEVKINGAGVVTIDGYNVTNDSGIATVDIINNEINILPNTGGVGNLPFVIGGLALITIAAIGCGRAVRKGKKKK